MTGTGSTSRTKKPAKIKARSTESRLAVGPAKKLLSVDDIINNNNNTQNMQDMQGMRDWKRQWKKRWKKLRKKQ